MANEERHIEIEEDEFDGDGGSEDYDQVLELLAQATVEGTAAWVALDGSDQEHPAYMVDLAGFRFTLSYGNLVVESFQGDGQKEVVSTEGQQSLWEMIHEMQTGKLNLWDRAALALLRYNATARVAQTLEGLGYSVGS